MCVRSDGVYLVIGGAKLHSLSALVAETLAEMGAGIVAVVGRSDADAGFLEFSKRFKNILALKCDITRVGSIPEALRAAGVHGRVRGICHGAACFDGDGLFKNVRDEAWEATLKPKVLGSLALIATAREENWELDFCLYLSSVAASVGNLGQCAYGAANSFQCDLSKFQTTWSGTSCKYKVVNFTVLDGVEGSDLYAPYGNLILFQNFLHHTMQCFSEVGVMHQKEKLQADLANTRGFPALNREPWL